MLVDQVANKVLFPSLYMVALLAPPRETSLSLSLPIMTLAGNDLPNFSARVRYYFLVGVKVVPDVQIRTQIRTCALIISSWLLYILINWLFVNSICSSFKMRPRRAYNNADMSVFLSLSARAHAHAHTRASQESIFAHSAARRSMAKTHKVNGGK